jgi:hypothetical protein
MIQIDCTSDSHDLTCPSTSLSSHFTESLRSNAVLEHLSRFPLTVAQNLG